MVSKYFKKKTNTSNFNTHITNLINKLKNKKVLLYGAGKGFFEFNQKYKLIQKLNIISIADKKFEDKNYTLNTEEKPVLCNIKKISPIQIVNEEYDYILVTNESYKSIVSYLVVHLGIDEQKILTVFFEEIHNETSVLNSLYNNNFEKKIKKLEKRLKNKTIMLCGIDDKLEVIIKTFDFSKLNIIGITDFYNSEYCEEYCGYKIYSINEIRNLKPDCILFTNDLYPRYYAELKLRILQDFNIKYHSLVKNRFINILKAIMKY